jgi:hypothetical protein
MRRSTVLSLPPQLVFLALSIMMLTKTTLGIATFSLTTFNIAMIRTTTLSITILA